MTRLVAALAVASSLAVAPAAPVPEAARRPLYHPTEVGTRWVYSDDENGSARVITAADTKDGMTTVQVDKVRADGKTEPDEVVVVSADGVSRVRLGNIPLDPGFRMLDLPAPAGAKWDATFAFRGTTIRMAARSLGPAEVEVPAGRFTALGAEYLRPDGGQTVQYVFWFAPRVGVVKMTTDGKLTRELVEFATPGKK
ncbi:MAG: hypothetical protein K2X82_23460 [Gemmataceae bacterium]|nr:hypothetical protein [Gemmataceae bacterium]